jgi:hypothetical protein
MLYHVLSRKSTKMGQGGYLDVVAAMPYIIRVGSGASSGGIEHGKARKSG